MASRNLYWTGAVGTDFAAAGNWGDSTNNINPATSGPNSTDYVTFTGSGGTITGTGTATLGFSDGSVWTLNGANLTDLGYLTVGFGGATTVNILASGTLAMASSSSGVALGNNTGASGTIAVSGTNALFSASTNNVQIGFNGTGLLSVSQTGTASLGSANLGSGNGAFGVISLASGGTLTATGGLSIGNSNGGIGLVSVDGQGSLLTLNASTSVGQNGSGTIIVSNYGVINGKGLTLASSFGSTGSLLVGGHGTVSSTGLNIGYQGNASVTITDGGRVASSGTWDFIGQTTGQNVTATVTVLGAGATWSSAGQLFIGGGGTASMTVGSGATLSVGGGLNLGAASNTSSTLLVFGGGTFIGSGSFNQIGNYGTASQAVIVSVDGAGTTWRETGQLNVNAGTLAVSNTASLATVGLNIGQASASNGVMKILSGSRVSSTGTADTLTSNAGGVGLLLIDGAGSVFSGTGNFSFGGGSGSLTLSNGGSMQVGSFGAAYPGTGSAVVQVLAGSTLTAAGTFDNLGGNGTASMTVDGAGAVFTDATGMMTVASGSGSGTLTVGHGGSVTFGALSVASAQGGTGVVNIGTLATLLSKSNVNVGGAGAGSVVITAGGTLTSQGTYDAFGGPGGSGTLNVSGAGALWKSAGSLNFGTGTGGVGALLISTGGVVSVVSGFNAGQTSGAMANVAITNGGTFVDSAGAYDFFGNSSQSIATGTVDGTGSRWTSTNALIIGNNGTASFTASNGAVVNANSLAVGQLIGSVGTFTAASGAVVTVGTNIVVGNTQASNGLLRVLSGGTIQVSASLQANQVLTVGGGAPGTDASGNYLQGASGTVIVSGTGSLLNLNGNGIEAGSGGTGSVIIANGGTILTGVYDTNQRPGARFGNTPTGNGSLLVTGTGSTFFDAGSLIIARGGSALLTVTNHGLLNVTTDTLGVGGIGIGAPNTSGTNIGGQGVAYVTNSGTVLDSTNLGVGVSGGNGVLYVNSQGSVSVGNTMGIGRSLTIPASGTVAATLDPASGMVNVGAGGTISILGNGITAAGTAALQIGNSLQATGVLNVSGAGALVTTNGHYIVIGNNGGVGTVNVTQGGTMQVGIQFSADAAALVGSNGGTGALVVSDAGSTFTAVGGLNIGNAGLGTLWGNGSVLVENHGTLNTGRSTVGVNEGVTIGRTANTQGLLTVTGTGSILSNLGRFAVGGTSYYAAQAGGIGTVNITNGGVVNTALPAGYINGSSSTNLNGFDPAGAAEIGASAGSDGSSVTVSGAGAQWNITGMLYVAEGGSGALSVDAGGTVTASNIDLAPVLGKTAVVTATGTGSAITIAGALTVGDSGNADLIVSNGATISVGTVTVGFSAGSTGNIDIEGAGSKLAIATSLGIGGAGAGTGVVTVGQGATLNVVHGVSVGAGSVLNVFGVLDPDVLPVSGVLNIGNGGVASANTIELGAGGQLVATGGAATIDVDVIKSTDATGGTIVVGSGAQLTLMGLTGAGPVFAGSALPTISFADATGALTVTDVAALANVQIKGFVAGDQIGVGAFGSERFAGGVLTLFSDANQTNVIGSLSFAGSVTASDVLAGVVQAVTPPCYAQGTLIRTTRGDVAVEALAVGDVAVCAGGHTRPIIWIGHREVACTAHPAPEAVWPIRIAPHAFGPGLPARPLLVSPDHAIYAGGVLIPASALVNGGSVRQVAVPRVTYWHIELDAHDILLAEGLPAESFLENGNRADFAGGDVITLHPMFASAPATPCAPMLRQGPALEAVRRKLVA